MEINHFSHDHPLFLSEEKHNKDFPCRVCGEPIFGISYCCMTCPYVLHKWCSELPHELSFHKSHLPDHPLFLTPKRPSGSSSLADCKICKKEIKTPGSAYTCIANECCLFNLHVECASFTRMINFEYMKTSTTLYFLRKYDENNKCLICGYNCSGPLLFSLSGVYVHVQCVMLPRMVKHRVHLHVLTLHPPLKENKCYLEFFCDACETERDPDTFMYYCEPCEFVAHIACGVSGSERPMQDIIGTSPVYESFKIVRYDEEDTAEKEGSDEEEEKSEDEREIKGEIEHFAHEDHPLIQVYYRRPKEEICLVCYTNIFGMTYECKPCEFYLHKWCANLPVLVQCSMHKDDGPLKLVLNYKPVYWQLKCEFCGLPISGDHYACENSEFRFHRLCALVPNNLNHESHEHTLTAVFNRSKIWDKIVRRSCKLERGFAAKPRCQACRFVCEGIALQCKDCNFYLHVHCFLLPRTGKNIAHRHDLHLTYKYEEDPRALEYFCDTCEQPRTPNRWVYCCPDPKCYIVSHVDCAVPKYFTTLEHQN